MDNQDKILVGHGIDLTDLFHFCGQFFVNFVPFFHAKFQLFAGLGALFKYFFFHAKLKLLRGWVVFLVPFLSFFHAKCQFFARLGGLFE